MSVFPPHPDNASLSPAPTPLEIDLAGRLYRHVDMLAGLIGPRHMSKLSSMEATTAYLRQVLSKSGYSVETQSYQIGIQTADNLIAEISGCSTGEQVVIVGAHYDTVPETPGADDNASAIAMLLELAKMSAGSRPGRTLRFVAFANEEPPHFYTETMGSQVYSHDCKHKRENIVGMICLEMVGYFSTAKGSQDYPNAIPKALRKLLLPSRGDFVAFVSNLRSAGLLFQVRRGFRKAVRFPLLAVPLPERIHEITLSDHGSFWRHGYPAIMVTDTSFFRNPHYHRPSDTPETLDYLRLARVTLGLHGAVTTLSCPTIESHG